MCDDLFVGDETVEHLRSKRSLCLNAVDHFSIFSTWSCELLPHFSPGGTLSTCC